MFSRLVRNTLNYSEQEFIALSKEVEFIRLYLELEKLRFKKDFDYEIVCKVEKSVEVPSLVIQPFLENALKHGLLHKKGHKFLKVTIQMTTELTCIISDNGIGQEQALKIKEKNKDQHNSFSFSAIQKRLEIFTKQYDGSYNYIVKNKYEHGKVAGTEVIVKLPFRKLS